MLRGVNLLRNSNILLPLCEVLWLCNLICYRLCLLIFSADYLASCPRLPPQKKALASQSSYGNSRIEQCRAVIRVRGQAQIAWAVSWAAFIDWLLSQSRPRILNGGWSCGLIDQAPPYLWGVFAVGGAWE